MNPKQNKLGSAHIYLALYQRLLTSILIDADRTDTACFEDNVSHSKRLNREELISLWHQYRTYCDQAIEQMTKSKLSSPLDQYRSEISEEVNREYKTRRDTLYKALKEIDGVICEEPKGAFYIMVKFPVDDCEKFIIWMLQNFDVNGETTMGAPGSGFYATPGRGKDEMRLAYVLKTEDLVKSGNILKQAVAAYPGRIEAIRA